MDNCKLFGNSKLHPVRSRRGARPTTGNAVGAFVFVLVLDATDVKVRENGRIISVAVIIAVAVNSQGRREVLGMAVGASEAETFWTQFPRSLARRGLRGVKLMISDDHKGLTGSIRR